MKKSNGGFSLVELIVVIAIMAILAGIAVPTYVKYIDEAENAKYINTLDEIKTAAIAAGVKDEKGEVSAIDITCNGNDGKITSVKITVGTGGTSTEVSSTYCESFLKLMGDLTAVSGIDDIGKSNTDYAKGATWNATDGWVAK